MKKNILFFITYLFISNLFAQLPNTDIWLLDIKTNKGAIGLTNPVNITNRVGYDNQPAFSPDGKYMLYTSIRDDKQSDIYKYVFQTKTISQFTKTATSEYSPTFMPDGKNISVVMVEPDSAQRLWKFPINGDAPSLILKGIDSIGYHCWLDNTHVALFLITNPMKLIFTDITSEKSILIRDTIGRSMHCIKNKGGIQFFYLYKNAIYSTDLSKSKTTLQTIWKFKGEDFCFINEYSIIAGNNSKLYVNYTANKDCKDGKNAWNEIVDLSNYGITNITRIAVSPDGKKLAIVAEKK